MSTMVVQLRGAVLRWDRQAVFSYIEAHPTVPVSQRWEDLVTGEIRLIPLNQAAKDALKEAHNG